MYGYRIKRGVFTIVPGEAAVIREIYADYLSGMGVEAILKKFRARGIQFSKSSIAGMLRNEKITGNLLLQKTFVADHLTKRQVVNRGQLPMYHVEGDHEAIIDKDTFEQVQAEIARRAGKFHPSTGPVPTYPFTGMIRCGVCGEKYRRKINSAGTKYARPVWICHTFNVYGRGVCGSQQIPESVLTQQAAIALGIPSFDAGELAARISEIRVPGANQLTFVFKDGDEVGLTWQTSRRDSWTPEMRRQAREDSLRGHSMRGGSEQ